MEMDHLTEQAMNYISDLFRDNSGGHEAAHTLRVYRNAMQIAESEPAKQLAAKRHAFLELFLETLDEETNNPESGIFGIL